MMPVYPVAQVSPAGLCFSQEALPSKENSALYVSETILQPPSEGNRCTRQASEQLRDEGCGMLKSRLGFNRRAERKKAYLFQG